MFLHQSVILFTGKACMVRGHVWLGTCMAEGHAWWGACGACVVDHLFRSV